MINRKVLLYLGLLILCVASVNAILHNNYISEGTWDFFSSSRSDGVTFGTNCSAGESVELINFTLGDPSGNADQCYIYSYVTATTGDYMFDVTNSTVEGNGIHFGNELNNSAEYHAFCRKSGGGAYNMARGQGLINHNYTNGGKVFHIKGTIETDNVPNGVFTISADQQDNIRGIAVKCYNLTIPSTPFNVSNPNGTHYSKQLVEDINHIIDVNVTHNTAGANCQIDSGFTLSSNDSNTYYFVNNTELVEGANTFNVECNTTGADSSTEEIVYFYDVISPNIEIFNPAFNGNIGTGDLLNFNCTDSNLFSCSLEVFYNETGTEILNWSVTDLTVTSINYTQSFTGIGQGLYTAIITANDSHTLNDISDLIYTNDVIGSTYVYAGVTYTETNVNGVSNQMLIRRNDRIITQYEKTTPNAWVEKLLTCSVPFKKVKESKYPAHLLCGSMWSDQKTNFDDEVELERVSDYQYVVRIKGTHRIFNTESVGIINTRTVHHPFYLDVNSNIDILIANASLIFTTQLHEQEDFNIYVNWTNATSHPIDNNTGGCNATLINGSTEEKASNNNFTVCGVGCDFETYKEEFEPHSLESAKTDIIHIDKLCHEQVAQDDVLITFECGAITSSETITAGEIPLCTTGDGSIFVNTTSCISATKINASVTYSGINVRRKRVEGLSTHREYDKHVMSYLDGDMFYNTSLKLWQTDHFEEWFEHGTQLIEANCTDGGLTNHSRESFTVENVVPVISYEQVINNENVTELVNGVGVEYSQGAYTWLIDISDSGLLNFSVRFYNSSGDSIINMSSLPLTTPDKLFLDKANPYTIQTIAYDNLNAKSESNLTFNSVGDVTDPTVVLLNNATSFPANETFNIRYRPDDDGLIDNCSIYVNWNGTTTLNQTDTSITTNSVNEFPLIWHTKNNYTYFINCTDTKGFYNVSGTGVFTIINQTDIVASLYNSNFLFNMGWFSTSFNTTSTAGVLLFFFLLVIVVSLIVLGEFTRLPIISVFAGLVGVLYGWLLASSVSSLVGVLFLLASMFYIIFSVLRD